MNGWRVFRMPPVAPCPPPYVDTHEDFCILCVRSQTLNEELSLRNLCTFTGRRRESGRKDS